MADAKAKAQDLASLSGATLGAVTYVSESTSNPPILQRTTSAVLAAPAADTSTSISPGELDITVDVQVAYTIQ